MALASVLMACVVLGLKALAYLMTGSVALYSDALESVVNVVAAVVMWLALRAVAAPPDDDHHYGHHKAEHFSAGLEGALIFAAAVLIAHEAWVDVFIPRELDSGWQGIAVSLLATALNAGWAWVLVRRGKASRSHALEADGRHLWTDVVGSLAVVGGVAITLLSGWTLFDPLMGFAIAAYILWNGWTLMRTSFGGLMDEAAAPHVLEKIVEVIAAKKGVALEAHDIKTRMAGTVVFVEFHLVVPAEMTVRESHEICDRLEAALEQVVHGAQVTIHVEPEEKAKQRAR